MVSKQKFLRLLVLPRTLLLRKNMYIRSVNVKWLPTVLISSSSACMGQGVGGDRGFRLLCAWQQFQSTPRGFSPWSKHSVGVSPIKPHSPCSSTIYSSQPRPRQDFWYIQVYLIPIFPSFLPYVRKQNWKFTKEP